MSLFNRITNKQIENRVIPVDDESFEIYLEFKKYLTLDKKVILLDLCNSTIRHEHVFIFIDFYPYIKNDKFLRSIFEKIIVKHISSKVLLYFSTYFGNENLFNMCKKEQHPSTITLIGNAFISGNINIINKVLEVYNINLAELEKINVLKNLIMIDNYELFLFYEKKWDAQNIIQHDLLSKYGLLTEVDKFNKILEHLIENYNISYHNLKKLFILSFSGNFTASSKINANGDSTISGNFTASSKINANGDSTISDTNIEITKKLEKKIMDIPNKNIINIIMRNLNKIFKNICISDSVSHLKFLFEKHIPIEHYIKNYCIHCFYNGALNVYLTLKNKVNLTKLNHLALHSKNVKMIEYILFNHPETYDLSKYDKRIKNEFIELFYEMTYNKNKKERKIPLLIGIWYGLDSTKPIDSQMFGMISVSNLFETLNFI